MNLSLIEVDQFKLVCHFYNELTHHLRNKGNYQWDRFYPNRFVIKGDLKKGNLFGIILDNKMIGAVVLNRKQSSKYKALQWEDSKGNPLVVHRLGIHPNVQGKGYGKQLLELSEDYARKNGYTSIRLDVYSGNPEALILYERKGYRRVGTIKFPFRSVPYYCYEKIL